MIAQDIILKIQSEIDCRSQESHLEAAAALAHAVHPLLKDLIATYGVDSQYVTEASDALAEALVGIVHHGMASGQTNDIHIRQIDQYVQHLPTSRRFELTSELRRQLPRTVVPSADFDLPEDKERKGKLKTVMIVAACMVVAIIAGYLVYVYAQQRAADAKKLMLRQYCDSLYTEALALDDVEAWKHYQDQVPDAYLRDSSARIDSLLTLAWSQEPTAWVQAEVSAVKDAYQRYLELYPDGEHADDAQARLVDIEVRSWRGRGIRAVEGINYLAPLQGDSSQVHIFNKTDYDLEMLLSGPTSKLMTIRAGEHSYVTVANGDYQVLIKVDNDHHDRLTFEQEFASAIYSSALSI